MFSMTPRDIQIQSVKSKIYYMSVISVHRAKIFKKKPAFGIL